MVDENDALKRLSNWFKEYNWRVLQDKKNELNNPIFHIKGESKKKPDLIIINEKHTIAIEVKAGNESLPLRTNSDIVTYFANYNDGKTFYFDENNKIISIDDFALATYFSPNGFLKENETLRECSERHYEAYLYGKNPKTEYNESFTIIRGSIWDVIKYLGYYEKYRKMTTGIGSILSTILDGDITAKPAFFIMKNHKRYGKSRRIWGHIWRTF